MLIKKTNYKKIISKFNIFIFGFLILFACCFVETKGATKLQTLRPSSNNLGLVGFWSFNGSDIVNGRVMDRSGTGAHGTPIDIATSTFYTVGKSGQGVTMDGVDDCVLVGDVATYDFDASTSFTVSGWYRRLNNSTTGLFISKKSASGNTIAGFYYSVITSNGGTLEMRISDGTNQVVSTAATYPGLNDSNWHHISVVVDRNANTVTPYIDGKSDTPASLATVGSLSNTSSLAFAARSNTTCSTPTPITVDDIRIYNRALSSSEVFRLYNNNRTKIQSSQNLKAVNGFAAGYSFDGPDIVNGKIKDVTGNGYDAPPTSISTSTFYTIGKIGQGIKTDGVNDCVISTGVPVSNFPFSLSAWVKVISNGVVMGVSSSADASIKVWNIRAGSVASMEFREDSGSANTTLTGTSKINDDNWHHIVGVFASDTDKKLYVDGVLEDFTTVSKEWQTGADRFSVGCRADSSPDTYFSGWIDDARLYTKALSESEINRLFNLGKAQ